ncbi:MAG: hypothetical protein ACOH1J_07110 [Microbacteriaceae bacterium]
MRWDNLFDDLESQLEHELLVEDLDERAEAERLRLGRLGLRDRIIALNAHAGGMGIRVVLIDGTSRLVHATSHGRDWFFVEELNESSRRVHAIIPLAAISSLAMDAADVQASIVMTAPQDEHGATSLSDRLGLTFVLRDMCRRRSAVEVRTVTGVHFGTIDRVGRDHLDLAEHERGQSRRSSAVIQVRVIPLSQLVAIVL